MPARGSPGPPHAPHDAAPWPTIARHSDKVTNTTADLTNELRIIVRAILLRRSGGTRTTACKTLPTAEDRSVLIGDRIY